MRREVPVRIKILAMLSAATTTLTTTSSFALDALWAPGDFDGAWVVVQDNAKNGCWTNIGETKEYASDQMDLAGFKTATNDQSISDDEIPFISKNHIALVVRVNASRWNDGLCVGHIMTYFVGPVVPRNHQDHIVTNPIGTPVAWTIWDEDNLNNLVLDHIKGYVPFWIEAGDLKEKNGNE